MDGRTTQSGDSGQDRELAQRIEGLSREDREALYAQVSERSDCNRSHFKFYFPDCTTACRDKKSLKREDHGALCRILYRQAVAWMDAGLLYCERLFMAANQIGKTDTAAFEMTCHLTGEYPHWWRGKRFRQPIEAWAAGDTMETTRDIIQAVLMGPPDGVQSETWTGMIPPNLVTKITRKTGGVPLCLHQIWVKHKTGGHSSLQFKSYDQGRSKFQGTKKHVIWLDEEPPDPPREGDVAPSGIYTECLLRTINTDGHVLVTFTPLRGNTPFIADYLARASMLDSDHNEKPAKDVLWAHDADVAPETSEATEGPARPVKLVVGATWDDAPHLTTKKRDQLYASMPAWARDSRTKGIPQLGSGAIYPFEEATMKIDPLEIPAHWPRSFAADAQPLVKSHLLAAWDRDTDIVYITPEFKRTNVEAVVQAMAIKSAGGTSVKGVGDAALLSSDKDRLKYIDIYRRAGLDCHLAVKGVESGIQRVYDRISADKLKVFKSCGRFFEEFRLYQRDSLGHVIKHNDHLMDCLRYLIASLERQPQLWTVTRQQRRRIERSTGVGSFDGGWMGS